MSGKEGIDMTKTRRAMWYGAALPLLIGAIGSVIFLPALARCVTHDSTELFSSTRHSRAYESPKVRASINEEKRLIALGNAARKKKDYSSAEAFLKQAAELQPSDWSVKMGLAEMLSEEGKAVEAFAYECDAVRPAVETGYPWDPITLARYAELARAAGKDQEAEWATRAIVLTASRRYSEFPKFTEDDLGLIPVEAMAKLAVGLEQNTSVDGRKALATFQSVVAENPRLALAHFYLAKEYETVVGVGYTSARTEYRQAASLGDPYVRAAALKQLKSLERSVPVSAGSQQDHK